MATILQEQTETEVLLQEELSVQKPKKNLYPYILALCLVIALAAGFVLGALLRPVGLAPLVQPPEEPALAPWITPAFLTLDGESRTGEKLEAVRDLAVHYVANPGTSAMANRNYFEGPQSNTSAHFIVGLEGEVLQLIPLDEKSHATNERNIDTISIEVCHPDATGEFSPATRESLVRLLVFLCQEFDLTEEQLIRHYDVTGKLCPLYYVEHPEAWEALKNDVKAELEKGA